MIFFTFCFFFLKTNLRAMTLGKINTAHFFQIQVSIFSKIEFLRLQGKLGEDGCSTTETFDAVLICAGHQATRNIPDFPGLSTFQGRVIHSQDFHEATPEDSNKTSLVVGAGNSGLDVAVEMSRYGKVKQWLGFVFSFILMKYQTFIELSFLDISQNQKPSCVYIDMYCRKKCYLKVSKYSQKYQ